MNDGMEARVATTSQEASEGSSTQPLDINNIYLEVTGEWKKGDVHGLGSQTSVCFPDTFARSARCNMQTNSATNERTRQVLQAELQETQWQLTEAQRQIMESQRLMEE